MKQTRIRPGIKIWRPVDTADVELISATGITEPLPKHVHTDFAMAVVEKGAYKIHNGADDFAVNRIPIRNSEPAVFRLSAINGAVTDALDFDCFSQIFSAYRRV